MIRLLGHGLWVVVLTVLSQIGGIAWLLALFFKRRWVAFLGCYAVLALSASVLAPLTGRVPLPCWGETLRMQSWIYCALNRHYAVPEMRDVLTDTAEAVSSRHPGTQTLVLDAGFPFFSDFPMLPHLSHSDGRKADLAFYYTDEGGYLPGRTRSPIGYFAFEPGPNNCPKRWPTLRWDFDWMQPLWPDWTPDAPRMQTLMRTLARDPRVGKVLLEPHLAEEWGVGHSKVRFQGCRAARHDDHIHFQL